MTNYAEMQRGLLFDAWWREQTRRGDPAHRHNLVEEAWNASWKAQDKRYDRLVASLGELQDAAQKVLDATDRNLDTKNAPQRYGAAFGPLAELSLLLNQMRGLRQEGCSR